MRITATRFPPTGIKAARWPVRKSLGSYTRRAVKWHKLLLRQMRTSRQDRSESGDADESRLRNRPEWSCRDARMRRFIFTEEVQQALAKDRYHHPDPRVQQRMEIVLLKSKGETHERIAELAGVSRRTVQRVLDVFEEEGLDGLRKFHWHG